MTTPAPEFSRTVKLDVLGRDPHALAVEADAAERAALAKRFGLESLDSLTASVALTESAAVIDLGGTLSARLVQACVATGEPVSAEIDAPVHIRFVAQSDVSAGEEVELDADDCDMMEHDGRVIDVGEAIAQSLALLIDPYPRSQEAEARLKAAGVLSEEEAGPFAALAALKSRLGKQP